MPRLIDHSPIQFTLLDLLFFRHSFSQSYEPVILRVSSRSVGSISWSHTALSIRLGSVRKEEKQAREVGRWNQWMKNKSRGKEGDWIRAVEAMVGKMDAALRERRGETLAFTGIAIQVSSGFIAARTELRYSEYLSLCVCRISFQPLWFSADSGT